MTCLICFQNNAQCICEGAANDNEPFDNSFIRIPRDDVLARPSSVNRLAMAYLGLALPRRQILNFVADQVYGYEGIVIYKGRNTDFQVDLDDVFGTDRDPSERWLSRFLTFGIRPPRQQAQARTLDRLTMLWLALAIHKRRRAELVVK